MPIRIAVIGCGHVGLVMGGCLARIGHDVVCADRDESIISRIKAGRLPFSEPNLDEIIARARHEDRITFTSQTLNAVGKSDAVFICVGAPTLEDGSVDLSAVEQVGRQVADAPASIKLVAISSIVPVGTVRKLKRLLALYSRNQSDIIHIVSNPQFLREGKAVEDFLRPRRVLIGLETQSAEQLMREIYRPVLAPQLTSSNAGMTVSTASPPELVVTTIESCELIKYAANAFLGLKISYANVLADLCEQLGADIGEVTHAIGLDPRIGPQHLSPGLGFGGSRFPCHIQALIWTAQEAGTDFSLLKEVLRINRERTDHFLEKTKRALWVIRDKRIGILGLAYRPDTDDIRYAPAIELVKRLSAEGSIVCAYDPKATQMVKVALPDICYAADPYEAAKDADALMILTEMEEFQTIDWNRMRSLMARPLVLDGRNMLEPQNMKALGFEYHSFGRKG